MSQLDDDLRRYKDELFTEHDLKAGWKLVVEIVGFLSFVSLGFSALTIWLPGIGIPISAGLAGYLMKVLGDAYLKLGEDDRKLVRAVAAKIRTAVGLAG